MVKRVPIPPWGKLTHAGEYLGEMLRAENKPVLSPFEFHRLVWRLYAEPTERKLYLRSETPGKIDTTRLRTALRKHYITGPDPDYGSRVIRILTVSDQSADDIVCLADPTCHVSHLSAMQRWGLTDRHPEKLILTRPDRPHIQKRLQALMDIAVKAGEEVPFPLRVMTHPPTVRQRPLLILETKTVGASLKGRGSEVRVSTIGQTFLDMLQRPDLCGGMSHVVDVWSEHANVYLNEIVAIVDSATTDIVKVRAGYLLEERLKLVHPKIESWKAFSQRGGSRKLDPDGEFAPEYSEVWMLSLNV